MNKMTFYPYKIFDFSCNQMLCFFSQLHKHEINLCENTQLNITVHVNPSEGIIIM